MFCVCGLSNYFSYCDTETFSSIELCPKTLYTLTVHRTNFSCYDEDLELKNKIMCKLAKVRFSVPQNILPFHKCGYRSFYNLTLASSYLEEKKQSNETIETIKVLRQFMLVFSEFFNTASSNKGEVGNKIILYFRKLNFIPRTRQQVDNRLRHLIKNSDFILNNVIHHQNTKNILPKDTKELRQFLYNLQIVYFNEAHLQKLTYIENIMKKVLPSQKEMVLSMGLKLYNLDVPKIVHYCYVFSNERCNNMLTNVSLDRLEQGYETKNINQTTTTKYTIEFYHRNDIKKSERCEGVKCTNDLIIQMYKISKKCFSGHQYISGNKTLNDVKLEDLKRLVDESTPERTRQCFFMCFVAETCLKEQINCVTTKTDSVFDFIASMHNDIVTPEQIDNEASKWRTIKTCIDRHIDSENKENIEGDIKEEIIKPTTNIHSQGEEILIDDINQSFPTTTKHDLITPVQHTTTIPLRSESILNFPLRSELNYNVTQKSASIHNPPPQNSEQIHQSFINNFRHFPSPLPPTHSTTSNKCESCQDPGTIINQLREINTTQNKILTDMNDMKTLLSKYSVNMATQVPETSTQLLSEKNSKCVMVLIKNGFKTKIFNNCSETIPYVNYNYQLNDTNGEKDQLKVYCKQKRLQYCASPIDIPELNFKTDDSNNDMIETLSTDVSVQNNDKFVNSVPVQTISQNDNDYDYDETNDPSTFNDLDITLEETISGNAVQIKMEEKLIEKLNENDKMKIIANNITVIPINKIDLTNHNLINMEIVIPAENERCKSEWVPIGNLNRPVRICPIHYKLHPSYQSIPMSPGVKPKNFTVCRYAVSHLLTKNFIRIGLDKSTLFYHTIDKTPILNMLEFVLITLSTIIDINFEIIDADYAMKTNIELNLIVAFNRFEDTNINGYFHFSGMLLINPIGLNKQQLHRLFMHEFLHVFGMF